MSILNLEIVDFNEQDRPRDGWMLMGYSNSGGTIYLTASGSTTMSKTTGTSGVGSFGQTGDGGTSGKSGTSGTSGSSGNKSGYDLV